MLINAIDHRSIQYIYMDIIGMAAKQVYCVRYRIYYLDPEPLFSFINRCMNEGKAREKALTERPAATWLISLLSHGTSF
jgi:hypothetical protein